ncbi:MAG TPA: secondary thiamine-phosphate synthase enzyme YjbQ [Candidatus Dormibacteraeota bacterium]|jgi:secondary thiamine-phosphate synthase enzyme|nr:secondary thiamine-phosphate synthase enzyme YjbQ [Candidatus Dormibacteraeota bacterium]
MATDVRSERLPVRSRKHADVVDITQRVQDVVSASGVSSGLCQVYVQHTTAGVFINENADPDVMDDFLTTLDRLVPWKHDYRHAEGNAAAHIKATLIGTSQTVPVREGKLALGTWQGIYFAEFDGPRERQVLVTVLR